MFKNCSPTVAALALCLLIAPRVGAHSYQAGALNIGHPWTRPTAAGAPIAVGYLSVTNTGKTGDKLLGAASPSVDRIELHQSTMTGDVARMRDVPAGVDLPPGQTVVFGPGGYHLMLVGPKRAFQLGERVPATLRFAHAGEVKVEFVVQDSPGAAAQPMPRMPGM